MSRQGHRKLYSTPRTPGIGRCHLFRLFIIETTSLENFFRSLLLVSLMNPMTRNTQLLLKHWELTTLFTTPNTLNHISSKTTCIFGCKGREIVPPAVDQHFSLYWAMPMLLCTVSRTETNVTALGSREHTCSFPEIVVPLRHLETSHLAHIKHSSISPLNNINQLLLNQSFRTLRLFEVKVSPVDNLMPKQFTTQLKIRAVSLLLLRFHRLKSSQNRHSGDVQMCSSSVGSINFQSFCCPAGVLRSPSSLVNLLARSPNLCATCVKLE